MKHPDPFNMARAALPWDDAADAREKVRRNEARAHYGAGAADERARVIEWLRQEAAVRGNPYASELADDLSQETPTDAL